MNAVLYSVQFTDRLNPNEVRRISTGLLTEPLWDLTPEDEYRALVDALNSGEELDTLVRTKHSEAEVREFLTRIVAELDAARPWPDPALQELSISRWTEFTGLEPVAQINIAWPTIQGLVQRGFTKPPGENREWLLVRLRSGAELALVWPGLAGRTATDVLSLDTNIAAESVIEEILAATSLDPSSITIL
ncbi:hypothetical protein AB0N05_13905 [Nocardia sp. NPDC051030]|uniref:hypothetical protein n=1 Tax=Nocardia sp. NPDC051030 TaxID=3155162 RepID=UPI00343DD6F8